MDVPNLFSVAGKVVLVTGGAKGIGAMEHAPIMSKALTLRAAQTQISEGFVRGGAKVYITSRDAKACNAAVSKFNFLGPGSAVAIPADFYKEEDCKRLASEFAKRESKLHILVNNSGSTWGEEYETYPQSAWTRVLTLNIQRVFTITQLLTPQLEAAGTRSNPDGTSDPARIINIGSVDALSVSALETFAYSASKAGLHHLSRVLAMHLGKRNITSNTIACGPFESKMMAATLKQFKESMEASIPMGRIGSPADVAGTCIFLGSRAGAWVNGATIALDGGTLVRAKL